MGFDLFGEKLNQTFDEVEPEYIKSQKFSNPLKHLYYNIILKENLNSKESIEKFLNKFVKNITKQSFTNNFDHTERINLR